MEETAVPATKERIAREVRALHPRLIEISHAIHDNPELGFQEHKAAEWLTEELKKEGFAVERAVAGLDTAFVATYGTGRPAIAFLAEYDALRGLGHACAHNLIAVWALGAGIALKRALAGSAAVSAARPEMEGTIQVIGTPFEEGGGGKVIMADAGVFRGLDAAIMMHGSDTTIADRGSLAMTHYYLEYFGKSAHASASPEKGVSALDAVLQVFFSVNAWRQMLKPDARIHGCITKGGDAPNIIPEHATAEFIVRAAEQGYHEEIKRRFVQICEAAALATGARLELKAGMSYKARVGNRVLIEAVQENMAALGIPFEVTKEGGIGSSDIGDVSQVIPTVHAYMQLQKKGIANHTREVEVLSAGPRADEITATGAALLACTGADVLLRPGMVERVRADFRERLGRDPQE